MFIFKKCLLNIDTIRCNYILEIFLNDELIYTYLYSFIININTFVNFYIF